MNSAEIWREEVTAQLRESAEVVQATEQACGEMVLRSAELIAGSLRAGGKLLLCGNGGSAADAQHLAAELVGRMKDRSRPALAALALTTDTAALTAIGNDYSFRQIFQRQVEALGRPGDLLMAISTSGRSANVLRAVAAARQIGLHTVGLTGEDGLPLSEIVNISICVPSGDTQRVQEAHIVIGHIICSLVERMLAKQGREETRCLTGLAEEL